VLKAPLNPNEPTLPSSGSLLHYVMSFFTFIHVSMLIVETLVTNDNIVNIQRVFMTWTVWCILITCSAYKNIWKNIAINYCLIPLKKWFCWCQNWTFLTKFILSLNPTSQTTSVTVWYGVIVIVIKTRKKNLVQCSNVWNMILVVHNDIFRVCNVFTCCYC